MFGRQNDQPIQQNNGEAVNDSGADTTDTSLSIKGEKVVTPTKGKPPFGSQSGGAADSPGWAHPGTPLDDKSDDASGGFIATPRDSSHTSQPADDAASTPPVSNTSPGDDTLHDLMEIKQRALSSLSPLIDHLDQSPEERFRTLLMMIQGSDDQSLVKEAYAVAQTISDEKIRAQALLDIVNEINYFASQHQS